MRYNTAYAKIKQ